MDAKVCANAAVHHIGVDNSVLRNGTGSRAFDPCFDPTNGFLPYAVQHHRLIWMHNHHKGKQIAKRLLIPA